MKSWLPPISTAVTSEYLSAHHSLKPTVRGSSAYVKRHYASRGMLPGQARSELLRNDELPGRPGPAVRSAILAALAVNAELLPSRIEREPEVEAAQMQWSQTSVGGWEAHAGLHCRGLLSFAQPGGRCAMLSLPLQHALHLLHCCSSAGDLEALDSILDQLVVKDYNMREALLKGPLISFETVVPNPTTSRTHFQLDPEYKDETFITGVQGVEEEAEQAELEGEGCGRTANVSQGALPSML